MELKDGSNCRARCRKACCSLITLLMGFYIFVVLAYFIYQTAIARIDFCSFRTNIVQRVVILVTFLCITGVCSAFLIPECHRLSVLPKPFVLWRLESWRRLFRNMYVLFLSSNLFRRKYVRVRSDAEAPEESEVRPDDVPSFEVKRSEPIPIPDFSVPAGETIWWPFPFQTRERLQSEHSQFPVGGPPLYGTFSSNSSKESGYRTFSSNSSKESGIHRSKETLHKRNSRMERQQAYAREQRTNCENDELDCLPNRRISQNPPQKRGRFDDRTTTNPENLVDARQTRVKTRAKSPSQVHPTKSRRPNILESGTKSETKVVYDMKYHGEPSNMQERLDRLKAVESGRTSATGTGVMYKPDFRQNIKVEAGRTSETVDRTIRSQIPESLIRRQSGDKCKHDSDCRPKDV